MCTDIPFQVKAEPTITMSQLYLKCINFSTMISSTMKSITTVNTDSTNCIYLVPLQYGVHQWAVFQFNLFSTIF